MDTEKFSSDICYLNLLFYFSPAGKKLTSLKKLKDYCHTNHLSVDPADFDFSRPKKNSVNSSFSNQPGDKVKDNGADSFELVLKQSRNLFEDGKD